MLAYPVNSYRKWAPCVASSIACLEVLRATSSIVDRNLNKDQLTYVEPQ